jgi:hypothetical protein
MLQKQTTECKLGFQKENILVEGKEYSYVSNKVLSYSQLWFSFLFINRSVININVVFIKSKESKIYIYMYMYLYI